MYVFELCAEGIFVTVPWWLESVKSRSKIVLFSNKGHFEIWFPKKKTIMFFWGKLSKLHKKDPILHVATTFPLKQGKTRTSHGLIPHPLRGQKEFNYMPRDHQHGISLNVSVYFETDHRPNMGKKFRGGTMGHLPPPPNIFLPPKIISNVLKLAQIRQFQYKNDKFLYALSTYFTLLPPQKIFLSSFRAANITPWDRGKSGRSS